MRWRNVLAAMSVAALVAGSTTAQTTTGKVAGRVTDAVTGEPLPGANIALVGTERGNSADINGAYYLIGVPPGLYTVKVSMVGYRSVTAEGVSVSVDLTTLVDFSLEEAMVLMDEILVTATLPLVQMDVSFAQVTMKAEEVGRLPVGSRLRDAFSTKAGVDSDAWGLTIRGGNEEELLYMVDGVGQKDNRNSRPYSSFSRTALEEVQIFTGGFNAEYGDVRSGVINVINKEPRQWLLSGEGRYSSPGRKHFGPAMYGEENWWDVGRFQSMTPTEDRDLDGRPDFDGWDQEFSKRGGPNGQFKAGIYRDPIGSPEQAKAIWDWQHRAIPENNHQNVNPSDRDADYVYDVTVGGPVVRDQLSFLLSNRRERTAYTWGLAVPSYRDNTVQAKMILSPSSTSKLKLGFIRGWAQGAKRGNFIGEFVRSPAAESIQLRNNAVFALGSETNIETSSRRYATLSWMHTLSPKTFYGFSMRTGKTDWLASWQPIQRIGVPAAAVLPDGHTETITETEVAERRAAGAIILDEAPFGFLYRPRASDLLSLYRLSGPTGGGRSGDWSWIWESDFSADFTSQVTPHHQIKGGLQVHHFYLREIRGYVGNVQDPGQAQNDFKPGNLNDPANLIVYNDNDVSHEDVADFHNYWVKTPFYGGLFFQDRMEYRAIIVNAGLRVDFHQPDRFFDLPNDQHAYWMGGGQFAHELYSHTRKVRPPLKWTVSPRLGISHPITTESKLFFNYGKFTQIPTSDQVYRTQSGLGEQLERLGNPWMEMPVTTAYEVGYERNFARHYLFAATVFYKDIENEVDTETRMQAVGYRGSFRFSTNSQIKDVRGLELSIRKAVGRYVSGFGSYEFRTDRRRLVGWRFIRPDPEESIRLVANNADGATPNFKTRPVLKAGLNLRTPLDYGGSAVLGGWEANLYYRREAGEGFNYNPTNSVELRNVNNAQWTDLNRLDVRISKSFAIQSSPIIFLEITNLLNSRIVNTNISRVFETAGGPRSTQNLNLYMEALGWTVDASGQLIEGDRPGKQLDPSVMPRRDYLFYSLLSPQLC